MAELLTSAQMRAIEAAAIDAGAVTGLELMERAGQGVVAAVFDEWPELAPAGWTGTWPAGPDACGGQGGGAAPAPPEYLDQDEGGRAGTGRRAVVLCGPGNNGGDGFVVARLLAGAGWAVDVVLLGDPDRLPPDAKTNYDRWRAIGPVTLPLPTDEDFGLRDFCEGARSFPDLFVDAIFGTGLNRPVSGDITEWYLQVLSGSAAGAENLYPRHGDYRVVAIDVPTGLCADSGRVLTEIGIGNPLQPEQSPHLTARPDLTVTFHDLKLGHILANGPECCGRVVCKDIGLPRERFRRVTASLVVPDRPSHRDHRPIDRVAKPGVPWMNGGRDAHAHKYAHGHALVLCGPSGKGGAARLTARAALRVGAGLVTLGCPHDALAENAAQLDAIMLAEIDDAATLSRILEDVRLNGLALGPGLGRDRARSLVPVALAATRDGGTRARRASRAVVLDADALSAFEDDPVQLFGMLHENCVLTPHQGEFKRLFPDLAEALEAPATRGPAPSRVDAARAAAARAECVVLLKGPDTVIADPRGRVSVHSAAYDRAAPWLATAGSGDVLTGLIAGLLARGFAPLQAAETAAWLHVEAARAFGPGLIAEDLPEAVPVVFRRLGL